MNMKKWKYRYVGGKWQWWKLTFMPTRTLIIFIIPKLLPCESCVCWIYIFFLSLSHSTHPFFCWYYPLFSLLLLNVRPNTARWNFFFSPFFERIIKLFPKVMFIQQHEKCIYKILLCSFSPHHFTFLFLLFSSDFITIVVGIECVFWRKEKISQYITLLLLPAERFYFINI